MFKRAVERVYTVNRRLLINYCSVVFFALQMTVVSCGFLGFLHAGMYLCQHSIKEKKIDEEKKRSQKYKISFIFYTKMD